MHPDRVRTETPGGLRRQDVSGDIPALGRAGRRNVQVGHHVPASRSQQVPGCCAGRIGSNRLAKTICGRKLDREGNPAGEPIPILERGGQQEQRPTLGDALGLRWHSPPLRIAKVPCGEVDAGKSRLQVAPTPRYEIRGNGVEINAAPTLVSQERCLVAPIPRRDRASREAHPSGATAQPSRAGPCSACPPPGYTSQKFPGPPAPDADQ